MRILTISLDLGPLSSPERLEAAVRAVRVAASVGSSAERNRVRREAEGLMKWPTDSDLSSALERLSQGSEEGAHYQARRLLEARRRLREDAPRFPPEYWFEYWYESQKGRGRMAKWIEGTGYERALASGLPTPLMSAGAFNLDDLNPGLYWALVADYISQHFSDEPITVRELTYRNPFGEELAAVDAAAGALEKTAGVIETSATLGSRRRLKKVEADLAEATFDDRVERSSIDVESRREDLRRQQIENEIAEQELLAKRIANAREMEALGLDRRRNALIDHFFDSGQLDEAEAIAALDGGDANALLMFAANQPQLEQRYEPDDDRGQ